MTIPKGKYVVAVSGGVDSMVLLDILAKQVTGYRLRTIEKKKINSNLQPTTSNLDLVVAHFNHGIRPDAPKDEELVGKVAKRYNLPFEVGYGKLGSNASEDKAREARYHFLNKTLKKYGADKIITAHHQDDLLETAILNTLRGTGRRGLTALADNSNILRPLMSKSKKDILAYAKKNRLDWREDESNQDEKYLRNYIRHRIIPKLSRKEEQEFLQKLSRSRATNRIINQEIANLSQKIVKNNRIDRPSFIDLPTEVASEILIHYLRQNEISGFDRRTIDRLTTVIKTAMPGSRHDVTRGAVFLVTAKEAHLATPD